MYADYTHLTYADKDVNIIQSCFSERRLTKYQQMADRQQTYTQYD